MPTLTSPLSGADWAKINEEFATPLAEAGAIAAEYSRGLTANTDDGAKAVLNGMNLLDAQQLKSADNLSTFIVLLAEFRDECVARFQAMEVVRPDDVSRVFYSVALQMEERDAQPVRGAAMTAFMNLHREFVDKVLKSLRIELGTRRELASERQVDDAFTAAIDYEWRARHRTRHYGRLTIEALAILLMATHGFVLTWGSSTIGANTVAGYCMATVGVVFGVVALFMK